jgi:hypothetical protein
MPAIAVTDVDHFVGSGGHFVELDRARASAGCASARPSTTDQVRMPPSDPSAPRGRVVHFAAGGRPVCAFSHIGAPPAPLGSVSRAADAPLRPKPEKSHA